MYCYEWSCKKTWPALFNLSIICKTAQSVQSSQNDVVGDGTTFVKIGKDETSP